MKNLILLLLTIIVMSANAQDFDKFFAPKSLRVDFALAGNSEHQTAYLSKLREEPVWGGPKHNLLDTFNFGGYYVRLYDKESGQEIYSRGFNTLFEEWLTTAEAKKGSESWINSVVVPFPKNKAILKILARSRKTMEFQELMQIEVDPASIFIDRSPLHNNKTTQIINNGDPAQKIDLVFIAEGYKANEANKFEADVRRFTEAIFKDSPFDKHINDFNVWAVATVSQDSGTDISGKDIWRNTALNSGFYTFGTERYVTTSDMVSVRNAVWNVPCDAIFVLVNDSKYGGGGMYNFYAMGTSDNPSTIRVIVHELGHSIGGLADEYFTSETAYSDFYNLNYEPWEPNITTLVDFKNKKWGDLLPEGTPIPTPVDKNQPLKMGVFEGGGYIPKGIYRPMDNCYMRGGDTFCAVCNRTIEQMIKFLSDK